MSNSVSRPVAVRSQVNRRTAPAASSVGVTESRTVAVASPVPRASSPSAKAVSTPSRPAISDSRPRYVIVDAPIRTRSRPVVS